MADIKMVIVLRKDLNMRKGKMVAQGCHASLKVFFEMIKVKHTDEPIKYEIHLPLGEIGLDICKWVEGIFTKITCGIDSEEELLVIYNKALDKNIPCTLIQDVGKTEFKGIPTYTCCAIGPAKSEWIDEITGHLSLL